MFQNRRNEKYELVVRNGVFYLHVKMDDRKQHYYEPFVIVLDDKKLIIDAAAIAASINCLPLNFCDTKQGMSTFTDAFIHFGQCFSSSAIINVNHGLPCAKIVRCGVLSAADALKEPFKKKLVDVFKYDEGIACDGVKIIRTGRKYYKLVMHFIELKRREDGGYDLCIRIKVLFLTYHAGSESAERIRKHLNATLLVETGRPFSDFEKAFKLVTDMESTMSAVFRA